MNSIKKIESWLEERNLPAMGFDPWQSLYNHLEELFEGLSIDSAQSKVLATKYQSLFKDEWEAHGSPETTEDAVVDSRCDKIVFAIDDLMKLGYSPELSLSETHREINSRVQDPAQARLWEDHGGPIGKWQKWIGQDPTTLYKADYSQCKLVEEDPIKVAKEGMRNEFYGQP